MPASYPGAIAAPRVVVNKTGAVYDVTKTKILYAEDVNNVNLEVVAIETALGVNLSKVAVLAGISGGQILKGGTAVTDILKLQGTAGNGTSASPAIQALVGNNGATVALTILNSGNVGIGIENPGGLLHVKRATFPVLLGERTSASTNTASGAFLTRHTTTEDMVDGFGASYSFAIQDNAGVSNTIATIQGVRNGADNSGALDFRTYSSGGPGSSKLWIGSDGKVGIGITTPQGNLFVHTNTDRNFFVRDYSAASAVQIGMFNDVGDTYGSLMIDGNFLSLNYATGGGVGIGVLSPTAFLHLPAGTASANKAPLKFTAGVLNSTPVVGCVEFTDDGTTGHLYVVVNQAGVPTRVQLA